ncbi:MAG: hypothetical protein QW134_08715, partial [Nitrososphaeria archaeon]
MFKPNNKKMLTVLIAVAMIFSAFAILSFAAQPAFAAASGTVTYSPTTLGVNAAGPHATIPVTTTVFVSGGTFSSGATVYFYLSTTDSATGLVKTDTSHTSFDAIGVTTLTAASPTSLDQAVTFFPLSSGVPSVYDGSAYVAAGTITPGTYYILASDLNPSSISTPSALTSYAFPAAATQIVSETATVTILNAINNLPAIGANALLVGGTGIAYGTGFDPGAAINVYLNSTGGVLLATATANSFGVFQASFLAPQLAGTVNTAGTSLIPPYTVVAEETNSYSTAFPQGGVTNDSAMDIGPTLTVSPIDITGASGASITLTGTGFPAAGAIASSTTTSPTTSSSTTYIIVDTSPPTNTYHASVKVSGNGQFSVSVTLASAISSYGPFGITLLLTDMSPYPTSITEYFFPALYISVPNPQSPGFYFSPVAVSGDYLPVFSPLTAAVFDFPAGVSVSVYLGSTLIGSVTTDSNGFGILPVTTTIPAIPAGTYAATAVDSSQGIVASPTVGVTTPITVTAFWMATDPLGNLLFENEFVPQNGTITVTAYGLAPSSPFYITDGAIGNVAIYGTNVTVAVGSVSPLGFFVPADNGTLKMSYQPYYGYYGITTGTAVPLATAPAPP